ARAFAGGDLNARVETKAGENSKDEVSVLTITFNKMIEELVQKGAEKEGYLSNLEEKNKELNGLNSKLTGAKEEIEVAFEELQSQSEEIQSTSEELRLLNEDMERKNAEIVEANRTIKKDEDELKNARDKLRLIYDTIKDYVLLTDKELIVLEANKGFAESLRTTESYVIGKTLCHLFDIKDPADCPARSLMVSDDIADSDAICLDPSSNCPVKRSLRSGSPVSLEMNVGNRILEWHSYPLSEHALFPEMAVVYIRDITEQRMLMQRLIRSDKLSSIGELVSGVAHELNNPLTSIMGYSELLLMDNINEASKKKAETIHESSQRCKRIVENLLTFSRSQKPEKTYQDINRLIAGTFELKAYRLDVEDIETKLDLDETMPMIVADGHQLQQVFLNLLNNAQQAVQEKGGPGTITIRTGYRNNRVFITFADSGAGIPENIIPRIFDPFFTTKEVGKGTGLGLSISYGIIKEHGGDIQVMSKRGAGTSFLIELPVTTLAEKAVMTISGPDIEDIPPASAGLKALLLDDEPLILDFVKEVLLDSGYSVDAVSEGQKALEMLGKTDYDIIISDMKMPGMSGRQFYLEAKRLRPESAGRIIFISGDTASKETQDFLKDTGNQCIQKPFTIQKLKEVISKVLG
ncbi:MAG: ATP-binding protein, partial [Nitrospirota bacterium]